LPAFHVDVQEATAVILAGTPWLGVLDVSDPQNITLMGSVQTGDGGYENDVLFTGELAFVTAGTAGLEIYDIVENPTPTLIGSYDTPGSAGKVVLSGTMALVADGDSLQVLDVSDPSTPEREGFIEIPCDELDVSGNLAYAVEKDTGALRVVDFGDPSVPIVMKTIATGTYYDTSVIVESNTLAYALGTYGIHHPFYHVLIAFNPELSNGEAYWLDEYFDLEAAYGMDVSEGFVYIADGYGGLVILRFDPPATPTPLTSGVEKRYWKYLSGTEIPARSGEGAQGH